MEVRALARVFLAFAAVALAPALCASASAQPQSPRTVLVVHWGPEEFPATPVVNAALRKALTRDVQLPVELFTEYLESDLFPVEQASPALADYIRRKYRGRAIDLVIAIADPALRFVLEHRNELFPGAPIVYSGVGMPETLSRSAGGGLTAVMRGVAYAETLRLALALHPATEQVFVVAKGSDQRSIDSVRAALEGFSQQVSLTYLSEETVARLLAAVKAAPPRSLILYIWHFQQDPGSDVNAGDVARMVAQASAVPVYGTNDDYIGSGVIGGVVRGTGETAARVGELARQILSGARAEDLPIEDARLVPILDWRQVQRWGIDPSWLPPESDIRFRVPTAWESYRSYIVGAIVVIAAQALLIAGLLTQRARRRRAEETIRAREATLRASYEQIRHLAGRVIHAEEAVRSEIARDLHDGVCQELFGVSMEVNSLKKASGHVQDAPMQQALSRLLQRALEMVEGVRRLSHRLHPASLRLVGLASALEAHCIEVERRHDVQVACRTEGDLRHIHPDVALSLFRIAQEALRNGAIHGDARRLAVSIARSGEDIELTVTDDGRGFDLEAVRQDGGGLGLVSIEERAHMIGGRLQIVASPQRGTTIRVRVPAGAGAEKDDLHESALIAAARSPRDSREQV
jgi:signal transduction histidine kinase